ncbi:MAG: TlpA disulfide reductase family protein [Bacteroidota bacterium]
MRVLFIAALLSTLACQYRPTASTTALARATATATATKAPAPVATASPDSTEPRIRYVVDTARPLDDIDRQFPYDIPLTNSRGEATISNRVLTAKGKPTVLLFWLTTCYPCKLQMREIKKHYANWRKEVDFDFYAISTDFPQRYPRFLELVKENQWPWPAYHDTHREFRKVLPGGLNGLPQVFVLNDAGEVLYHRRKYQSGDEWALFERLKAIAAAQ